MKKNTLQLVIFGLLFILFNPKNGFTQCNTNTTICEPGVAGPFIFEPASANPGGCLSFINGQAAPNYAYIILYITQGGTLDLLILGNNTGPGAGCLDVQLFDITGQSDPCASLNFGTQIGCNYVNPCDGCAEFGFTINGCPAQVAGPTVNAGDVIMILVEDYSDTQTSFTLELGNDVNSAQTGPPDATITNGGGQVCDDAAPFQLNAVDMGGTWSGPGTSADGIFDPAAAGIGTHTIDYTIGSVPCDDQGQTTIEVIDCGACLITYFEANISACITGTGTYDVTGVVEYDTPPATGNLVLEDCYGNIYAIGSAPFANPGTTNYNITGLVADGAPCSLVAYFVDDPACTSGTLNYTAPTCPCSFTYISTNISACDPTNNTFEITGSVEFVNPPSTGTLTVTDCNGNQQVFNAPFTSPTNYALTGIDSDATPNCDVTATFSDDPTCTINIGPFDYPAACMCLAEIGTFSDGVTGNANSAAPWNLCFGDELNITGNGDVTLSQDFNVTGVTYDPGVWLLVYDCPPSVFPPNDINTDPCLLGVASTADQVWTIINDVGDNSTLYFVPITMYSMVDGIYAISINGGDWCYDLGPSYQVTFLQEITTTQTQDCQAGTATVTINGGLPSFDGSLFTASNLSPASAVFDNTTAANGGTITISGLVDGDNWSFDITDDNDCPITVSGTFIGLENPSFTYPNDTYCETGVDPSPTITGTPGGTFTAAPAGLIINATSGVIDLSSATGTFTITYTTPDPVCFDSEDFIITITPNPVIDPLANQIACDSYTLPAITGTNLTGGQAYYTGTGGSGTQLNAGDVITTVGITTLYIYDETGTTPNCFDEQSFTVTINLTPIVDSSPNQVACDSYALPAITGTNLTGNEAYYTGTGGTGTQYNAGNAITTGGTTTIYIYDETGTTPNCFDEQSFTVTINITPTFTLSSTDPTACGAADGTITISGLVPNTTYDITYSDDGTPIGPNAMTSDAAGDIVITGLSVGTYSNFVVTLNGCTTTDNSSINLADLNAPPVNAGVDQEICDGEQVTLTADNPDGANISWNNGVTDGVAFTPAVGTVTYTVTAELTGCISIDQVNVTVHPNPIVFAGNDILICEGESVTLTGSGADNYVWDNGVTNGVSFNPTTTQTYTVVGTTNEGCQDTDDVVITVEPLPSVSFVADNFDGCVPVTVTFTNTSSTLGEECIWNFGDGSTAMGCEQVTHTFNSVGCFDVTLQVTSANGCTSSSTIVDYICVSGYPNAAFDFSPGQLTTIATDAQFSNNSTGATSYEWNFGDGQTSNDVNPSHTFPAVEDTFLVELIATSPFGCKDTAYAVITVFEELIFYVPNTFTPDNDDFNEVFKPIFTSGFDPFSYNLLIFNRWGEVIFESNNSEVGWDGTYGADNDQLVKDGTYVWKITFKTKISDERIVKVGHVNVLK